MYEALKQVVGDGKSRTLSEMADAVLDLTGKQPQRSTLGSYIAKLRGEGYQFNVARFGRRGGEAIYKLHGTKGRRRKAG